MTQFPHSLLRILGTAIAAVNMILGKGANSCASARFVLTHSIAHPQTGAFHVRRVCRVALTPNAHRALCTVRNIKVLCIIASMPGLERLLRDYPGLEVWVGACDQDLNEKVRAMCP